MTIYLVRHGESECNVKGMLYGRTDCALTELGRRQAAAVAEKLRGEHIERCVASPLIRASDTAGAAASALGLELEYDERLMEQDMGEWENVPFMEYFKSDSRVREMMKDWTVVAPPGGESFDSLRRRVAAALDDIVAAGKDTLIVAHAGPLSAGRSRASRVSKAFITASPPSPEARLGILCGRRRKNTGRAAAARPVSVHPASSMDAHLKPEPSMAALMASSVTSAVQTTEAVPASWLASALSTPGRASSTLRSLPEQPPQCIPSTFMNFFIAISSLDLLIPCL